MERKNTSLGSVLNLDSDAPDRSYCLSSELNVDFLRILFKFLKKKVNIFDVGKPHQKIDFRYFYIQRVLKRAKEHSHFFLENSRPLLQNQVYVFDCDELHFRFVVHQRNERGREFAGDRAHIVRKLILVL